MTRRDHVHKWLLYALGVLPVWLAETLVLNRFPLFGVIPVLLPLAAVAAAMWEGPLPGAVFGLCLGVVADATYPGTPGGMTLALAVMGCLTGALCQYGLKQNFVGYLLCSAASMGILELFRVLGGLLTRLAGLGALLKVTGLEALWSLCFTPLIYALFKRIHRRVGGDELSE